VEGGSSPRQRWRGDTHKGRIEGTQGRKLDGGGQEERQG